MPEPSAAAQEFARNYMESGVDHSGAMAALDALLAQAREEGAREVADRVWPHLFHSPACAFVAQITRRCDCGLDSVIASLPARSVGDSSAPTGETPE